MNYNYTKPSSGTWIEKDNKDVESLGQVVANGQRLGKQVDTGTLWYGMKWVW